MKQPILTLLMLWCAIIAYAQPVFAQDQSQQNTRSSYSNELTTFSSESNSDQNNTAGQLKPYCSDTNADNNLNITNIANNNRYDSSNLRWGWNVDAQIGASVFYGAPLGCAHTLSKIRPALRAHIGKWFTPTVGSRLSWEMATMKAADMEIHRYQAFHMDILWNLAPMLSCKDNFTLAPYFGAGCLWNQTIGHAPMALSYGVTASVNVSKHLSVVMELGALTTFKYFDGLTRYCNDPEWDYRHPRLGENIVNFSIGLSYCIPSSGKKSLQKGWECCSKVMENSNDYGCWGYNKYADLDKQSDFDNQGETENQYDIDVQSFSDIKGKTDKGKTDPQNDQRAENAESLKNGQRVSDYEAEDNALGDTGLVIDAVEESSSAGPLYSTEELLALVELSNQVKKAEEEKKAEKALENLRTYLEEEEVEVKGGEVGCSVEGEFQKTNEMRSEMLNGNPYGSESKGTEMLSELDDDDNAMSELRDASALSELTEDNKGSKGSEGKEELSELTNTDDVAQGSKGTDWVSELTNSDDEAQGSKGTYGLYGLSNYDDGMSDSKDTSSVSALTNDTKGSNGSKGEDELLELTNTDEAQGSKELTNNDVAQGSKELTNNDVAQGSKGTDRLSELAITDDVTQNPSHDLAEAIKPVAQGTGPEKLDSEGPDLSDSGYETVYTEGGESSVTKDVNSDKEGLCPCKGTRECACAKDQISTVYTDRIQLSKEMDTELQRIFGEFEKLNRHENLMVATQYDFPSTGDRNLDENIRLRGLIDDYWDLTDRLMDIFLLGKDSVDSNPYVCVNESALDMERWASFADNEYEEDDDDAEDPEDEFDPEDDEVDEVYEPELAETEVSKGNTRPLVDKPGQVEVRNSTGGRTIYFTRDSEPEPSSTTTDDYTDQTTELKPIVYIVDKKGNIIRDATEEYHRDRKRKYSENQSGSDENSSSYCDDRARNNNASSSSSSGNVEVQRSREASVRVRKDRDRQRSDAHFNIIYFKERKR